MMVIRNAFGTDIFVPTYRLRQTVEWKSEPFKFSFGGVSNFSGLHDRVLAWKTRKMRVTFQRIDKGQSSLKLSTGTKARICRLKIKKIVLVRMIMYPRQLEGL